jgi:hypothetical protein
MTNRGPVMTSERDLLIAGLDALSHVPSFDEQHSSASNSPR